MAGGCSVAEAFAVKETGAIAPSTLGTEGAFCKKDAIDSGRDSGTSKECLPIQTMR